MATATQNSVHEFERAGLGKAPFRVIGVSDKIGPLSWTDPASGVTMMVGSPGQPMGTCKFCGQGIQECWSIRSADGKTFDVGCDCVRKAGDAGMKKVVDAAIAKKRREKAHAKGETDRAYVDAILADEAAMARLAAMPHPKAGERPFFADKTFSDYVAFMRRGCGDAGIGRLAKHVLAVLS